MKKPKRIAHHKQPALRLRLYVANTTPRSVLAMTNLRKFCEQYVKHEYRVQIVDIVREPELAFRDDILATPTLVRTEPGPQKVVIGSLSEPAALFRALDLEPPETKTLAPRFKSATFVQEPGAA